LVSALEPYEARAIQQPNEHLGWGELKQADAVLQKTNELVSRCPQLHAERAPILVLSPVGAIKEAAGYLRTNLLFQTANDHPKVILITSSNSAHGKSSVALSLAESFARNEHRTPQ